MRTSNTLGQSIFSLSAPGYFDGEIGVVSGVAGNSPLQCKWRAWKGAPEYDLASDRDETPIFMQNTGSWNPNAAPPMPPQGPSLNLPQSLIIGLRLAMPFLALTYTEGLITLSWDPSRRDCILETTASLTPPVQWSPATGVVNNQVTVPVQHATQFYRLRR